VAVSSVVKPSRAAFTKVTRSIAGSLIASTISRWYGHKRTGPGSADTSAGRRMLASIHVLSASRGGERTATHARALRQFPPSW
jgi:hypothetical protein